MSESEAERARRVTTDPAAPLPRSGTDDAVGTAEWDEWYCGYATSRAQGQVPESPYDFARRAFLAGWAGRDAVARREAADELTRLTEELGLYDDRGGS